MSVLIALLAVAAQPAAGGPRRDAAAGREEVQAQRERRDAVQGTPPGDSRRIEQPPERGRRSDARLNEEDRRNLRRDIDRADREIYRRR